LVAAVVVWVGLAVVVVLADYELLLVLLLVVVLLLNLHKLYLLPHTA
jgi:hypothetical protein